MEHTQTYARDRVRLENIFGEYTRVVGKLQATLNDSYINMKSHLNETNYNQQQEYKPMYCDRKVDILIGILVVLLLLFCFVVGSKK